MKYFLQKLQYALVTLFLIITLTFFLMKAIPGDPFTQEQAMPKEVHEALLKHYGLDRPLFEQYVQYLKSILIWDLGPSFKYPGRTVNAIIKDGFPVSAILGVEALVIALTVGVTLGTFAALKHNRWQDVSAMALATLGMSVPSFLCAAFLQYLLAIKLGWFPIARWGSFMQSVLPALALASLPTAFIARLTRASLLEILRQDYIKTAKAKGLTKAVIILRHALPNALLPVITYLGPLTANILLGSFIIEKIFAVPGLGHWFVTSVSNRDYTVIMGTTVFYSIIMVSAVFFVELIYAALDPRMKSKMEQ